MKPGILLMVRSLDEGGSERQTAETALALDRSRFEPHVGAFRPEGSRGTELRAAGIPVFHVPVRSFKPPGSITAAWVLARYIRDHNIRLVHTFDVPLTFWAIPATLLLTRAVALASHRAHLDLAPPRLRRAVVFAMRRAHGVVVNCKFLERNLIEDAAIPPRHIHLCYNALDLSRFGQAPSRPEALPPGGLVIGSLCVLRPEKGLLTVVEAFAQVRRQLPNLAPDLRLAIVGSGPMLPDLERRASQLGVRDACIFQPAAARVADWLSHIDIFVLPSLSEALSNSLMEAMACGCCAVASNVGGNPELVDDGARGLLFPPGNAAALAGSLCDVILNPDLRRRLADAGRDFVRSNFSRERTARRIGEIYSELLEKRP